MSQEMSLTTMLLNLGTSSSSSSGVTATKDFGAGYLKLPNLPKDENMFAIWKLKVESTIRGNGLMNLLECDKDKLELDIMKQMNVYRKDRGEKDEAKELTQEQKDLIENKSYRVYSALADTLTTADQMRLLLNKEAVPVGNAFKLWTAIKERYDIRTTDATKERLWALFNGMKMENKDTFLSYKTKVEEAVANLSSVGESVPENRVKAKLVTGLTTRYSAFVGALYTQDYSTIKIVDLCKKINDFEESTVFKNSGNDNDNEPDVGLAGLANGASNKKSTGKFGQKDKGKLQRNDRDKAIECFTCHKVGHRAFDCYRNKNAKKCSNCKRIGHNDSECRYPSANKNWKKEDKEEDNGKEEYGNFFGSVVFASNEGTLTSDTWLLDSGASRHLCADKNQITNLTKVDKAIKMKVANKQMIQLNHIGTVGLKTRNGNKERSVKLTDVAYAPTFQCNLISVGKLIDAGAEVRFGEKGAIVFHKGVPVITAKRCGNLFVVQLTSNNSESVNVVTEEEKNQMRLWHNRLGHVAYSGLRKMINNNSVDGMGIKSASVKELRCEGCLKGKQHRHPFSAEWRDKAKEILDRVHADLCGPVQETRNGELYLSTVVDERSRMLFGEIIKKKSDAAASIVNWCNKAKTLHGRTVKEFHSDGGGEFRSQKKLLAYFKQQGIEVTCSLPGTPQHNGIAERSNRTVFESARSMLFYSGLPNEFWGDAVMYAIYIRNRCLTTADKNKSPYELWTGRKANVSHIRTFGCDAFMHVKDTDRTKLEPKSIKCVLLGFSDYYKGYKLYSIEHKRIFFSRDVLFREEEFQHAAQLKNSSKDNDKKKAGNPIEVSNPYEALIGIHDEEVDTDEVGIIDAFDKESAAEPSTESEEKAEEKEDIVQEENNNEEAVSEPEPQEEKAQEAPPQRVRMSRELRRLAQGNHHQMFSGPRDSRRNAPLDPGAVITDSKQMEEFSQSVTDHEDETDYCFVASVEEPESYADAMKSENATEWKEATDKEYQSLIDNKTWTKCRLPNGRKAIGCKWIYKAKINKDGEIERYKARLVAKGYSQKEGIDYKETFAPVLKYKSLRILLAIAAIKDLEIKQMDVETAFLNAPMKEEVYMEQPEGFHDGDNRNVLLLLKTLYGTKQAPHEWNSTLNDFIVSHNFSRCVSDTCTYIRRSKSDKPIIIAVFVDDIIILYDKTDESEWLEYKKAFMSTFKMKDLNDAEWILGIRITRDRTAKTIKLDHEIQIDKTLTQFQMSECNPAKTPTESQKLSQADCPTTQQEKDEMSKVPYKSMIGALQYIALSTRPDIAYSINQLSRYLANPGRAHWLGGKRVLRYLKGTAKAGLLYKDYSGNQDTRIELFCDADWAGNVDDRKSTTGIVIKVNGCVIVWLSKKQTTVALSTAEAEYIAMATALQELIWINQYLTELGLKHPEAPVLRSDNQAAIQIANNDVLHNRTKHIDIRYHFIREIIRRGEVQVEWIHTKDQQADINTKGLDINTFKQLRDKLITVVE